MGTPMILSDLILTSTANQLNATEEWDTLKHCLDVDYYKNYPYPISYRYNSRGFRDKEWPDDQHLKDCIWCVGDSFTLGVGQPYDHIWPQVLEKQQNERTINVSMEGASNNWIARRAEQILNKINPKILIIHWSFIHRREKSFLETTRVKWREFYASVRDSQWPDCEFDCMHELPTEILKEINEIHHWTPATDEERKLFADPANSDHDDITNTINCINLVEKYSTGTKIIHSVIPDFAGKTKKLFVEYIEKLDINYIPEFKKLDLARDSFHYDIKTAEVFAQEIGSRL